MAEIKNYVSRYVVPFYFSYENNGYKRFLEYFRTHEIQKEELGLPKDCKWVEKGFWENYKSNDPKQPEMDIYSYLLQIFKEYPEQSKKYNTNIGNSFVLKTSGSLFTLQYQTFSEEGIIGFSYKDLGILIFRNGIGFIWYDIEFAKKTKEKEIFIEEENTTKKIKVEQLPDIQTYVKFQNEFKELARTHSEKFLKKTGKDSYEVFNLGKWLESIIDVEQFEIRFWAERQTKVEGTELKKRIPDKALLFQYLFVDEASDTQKMELAFHIANGYDEKYIAPKTLINDIYEPFGNTCFYTSKTGASYVVSNNDSNENFFIDNFKEKFTRDYFLIYIMLLYQTYSCAHYSRLLTKLPAEKESFEENAKYVENLESLDNQIKLFLVKSVYESVSNIQHQNGAYKYGKKVLAIEEDIKSLTIGLDALRGIEREKIKALDEEKAELEQKKNEKKEETINNGLILFGFLVVISSILDAINLVDWFLNDENKIHLGHIISIGGIGLLTSVVLGIWIFNKWKK